MIPIFLIQFFGLFLGSAIGAQNIGVFILYSVAIYGVSFIFRIAAMIIVVPFYISFFKNFYLDLRKSVGSK
jgi:uncharacterized protein HemY